MSPVSGPVLHVNGDCANQKLGPESTWVIFLRRAGTPRNPRVPSSRRSSRESLESNTRSDASRGYGRTKPQRVDPAPPRGACWRRLGGPAVSVSKTTEASRWSPRAQGFQNGGGAVCSPPFPTHRRMGLHFALRRMVARFTGTQLTGWSSGPISTPKIWAGTCRVPVADLSLGHRDSRSPAGVVCLHRRTRWRQW